MDSRPSVLCRARRRAGITRSLRLGPGTACPAEPHPSVGAALTGLRSSGTALSGLRVEAQCQELAEDLEPHRSPGSNEAAVWTQRPSSPRTCFQGLSWVPQVHRLDLRT